MSDYHYKLIRILGNDLPPRHAENQTIDNLKFILENEYAFDDTEKIFIFNKIVNQETVDTLSDLVLSYGHSFVNLPFSKETYMFLNEEQRIRYLTSINKARNLFLTKFDKDDYEIILPLDGNCFFRLDGWMRFVNGLEWGRGYAAIQMARCIDYPDLTDFETIPSWYENWRFKNRLITAPTEPQIAFLPGFDKIYDEDLLYGEASKLGLLYSIGYRGVWDNWYPEIRAKCTMNQSRFYRKTCEGGWLYRLPSGVQEAEMDNQIRAKLRNEGIKRLLNYADKQC